MELIIKPIQAGEVIEFNYAELKAWVEEKRDYYESLVYTDDNIADVKKDKAEINKFIKQLNDARISKKKEILKPIEDFEAKVKELESIIREPLGKLDAKAKAFEDKRKADKKEAVRKVWEKITERPEWLKCADIWDSKWLNASTSLKSIEGDIRQRVDVINSAVAWISEKPYAADALEVYKQTLDIQKAMSEGERLYEYGEKVRKELEACTPIETGVTVTTEQTTEEQLTDMIPNVVIKPADDDEIYRVAFSCDLTADQAKALREFCDRHYIKLKPINRG